MGGYGDFDLIGHLQPSATLKILFGEENKDMPLDLFFVRPGQPVVDGHILFDYFEPGRRKRLLSKFFPPPLFQAKHVTPNSAVMILPLKLIYLLDKHNTEYATKSKLVQCEDPSG
jgi:hypothetical protein